MGAHDMVNVAFASRQQARIASHPFVIRPSVMANPF
jgi:hypothetical protein